MLSRAWSLPPQRNFVAVQRNVQVPMSDGTVLLADHYLPITSGPAATVLVRCPYGRGLPFSLLEAQLVAERGFHVLLQSCRGTFGSRGQFEPMRDEIRDGQDTVAWLRGQRWFDGRLATFGASYLGFVQWALAMDPPPELVAAVVWVGPHDLSRVVYRHGAFGLYDSFGWSDLIAHQERVNPLTGMIRTATADRRLRPALNRMPVRAGARDLVGDQAPWVYNWLEHPDPADPYWAPVQCGAALERISVPTMLIGGWQDLFLEQTLEQFRALAERGVPTRMLIGPWSHLDTVNKAGAAFAESLAWLERHAGQVPGQPATGHSVRLWVGGAREWRELPTWPPAGQVGGAILALTAGVRDNRPVEQRPDVLLFTSEPLAEPVEIVGDVTAELHVTRDNPNADLFVRLCDVDAKSRSRNVCDGIVRLTEAGPLAGTVQISLTGAAHRFHRGHRLRIQVAGGAHPRFARNPGNGQVDALAGEFAATNYSIEAPSSLVLSQSTRKAVAHA
jgi:predicted acyl esterase